MASTEDLRVTSNLLFRERSGSVVECLTRDRGAAGVRASPASLCCVLEQDTLILAKYWFNPGRPVPTLLKDCWRDVQNLNKQTNEPYIFAQ